MKSLILKISLRYGLIMAAVNLLLGLVSTLTFGDEGTPEGIALASVVVYWLAILTCIILAHYTFNNRNDNYISFADAIDSGLIIIGISFIVSTLYLYINHEFLLKDKMDLFYSRLSRMHGIELKMTTGKLILNSFGSLLFQIVALFIIITLEARWKIFKKAGKEGWASIVPVYGIIVFLDIIGKPSWWIILLLIPVVNIFFGIHMVDLLAKRFGKGAGFTAGLLFLPFIFYPLLGLSKLPVNEES